ncbi:MAG TPA: ABC-type transport auxiliary lipoprotein family protein [Thermoanaerobaculia bacterium]
MRRRLLLVVFLVLAGCSFFSKSKSTTYSLDPIAAAAPLAKKGTAVAIETIELSPGLDRREIVVRKANRQLDVRSNDLWPAALQPVVLHALAFDLASRLPEGMVVLPGESRPAAAPRGIDVVFEDLSAGPENRVTLDARWTLGGVSHHEQIAIDVPSLDSGAVATGTSQALAALADRIAAGV